MQSENIDAKENALPDDYGYSSADDAWQNGYIISKLKDILKQEDINDKRIFEIGCGNGATANIFGNEGFHLTGIDSSISGINVAKKAFPRGYFSVGSAYDELAKEYGTFPIVISLEVIEHCFYPRKFIRTFTGLIEPGGIGIISTPYHGYLKNLVLALTGKWDTHLGPLWDGGHIKFFSMNTLGDLLTEAGFKDIQFYRVGRIPLLAKSMIAVVRK